MLVSASAGPEANTEPLGVKQQVWISSVSHCKRRRMEKISVTRREKLLSTLRAASSVWFILEWHGSQNRAGELKTGSATKVSQPS